jgi:purine-binding chemotaxis protein CheW
MNADMNRPNEFVIFNLDTQLYGIDIQSVQIIERIKSIQRVPKAPRCIQGVMNLRGEIIPLINLREQFQLAPKEYSEETRIIIIKLEDTMTGIIVDSVREVLELTSDQIETVQNVQGKMNNNHILGVGKIEEGTIITLLHLKNIVEEAFEIEQV